MKGLIYFLFILVNTSLSFGSPLTLYSKCYVWDSSCLTELARAVAPVLFKGIPGHAAESLDTLFVDRIRTESEEFCFEIRNVQIRGLRNSIIERLSVDIPTKVIRVAFHGNVLFRGHYTVNGSLLSIPIYGEGEAAVDYYNTYTELILPFEIMKNGDGRNVINLNGYQFWVDIRGSGVILLDNLYYGDTELSKRMHSIMNQNTRELLSTYYRRNFDKVIEQIFHVLRNYLISVPYDHFITPGVIKV